jgi:hypothetical protein
MNNYPAKPIADQLAQHGRYGDTMLVHMNPIEVAGIASLTPGGLTTNPVTGQPEAFAFLLPLLASGMGTAMGLGALGTAALSGGLTAAVTGDIKRGLMAGVMGAGIGNALGNAGGAGADLAAQEAAKAAIPAATTGVEGLASIGTEVLPQSLVEAQATSGLASIGTEVLPQSTIPTATSAATSADALTGKELFRSDQFDMGDRTKMMFNDKTMGEVMKAQNMLPIAMGAGQLEQMDMEDAWARQADELKKERGANQQKYYDDLQRGYAAAQPNAPQGTSPYRSQMSRNMPPPWQPGGMAAGGIVNMPFGGQVPGPEEFPEEMGGNSEYYMAQAKKNRRYGGYDSGYGGIDPVTIQQRLHGQSIAPPQGFMAGFNPEMKYFQNLEEGQAPNIPMFVPPHQSNAGMYSDPTINRFMQSGDKPYFESILAQAQSSDGSPKLPAESFPPQKPTGLAQGGEVPIQTSAPGQVSVSAGGIANIPQESMAPQGMAPQGIPPQGQPAQPEPQDIQMLAGALQGQVDPQQAYQIVNMFVEKYGVDMFKAVRDMILKQSAPDAQTEGMVQGQGGGMDDQVPGMIGNSQPVAVSPGEYIVPADVVSGLGDGSSDAGAQELDQMLGNVRQARTGGQMQPPPIDHRQVMPR